MATLKIITDDDLANKGVMPLADVPGLSADDMKYKFEEIVRAVVITTLNQNMQLLEDAVFVDPESHTYYLRQSDLLTTYQAIKDNVDAGKVAAAVAVKEMDTSLKQSMSTISGKVTTLEGKMTTVEGKVATLESQGFITFDKNDGNGVHMNKSCVIDWSHNTTKIPSTAPAFTRSGYTFLGWSTNSSSAAADYQTGDTVSNLDQHIYGNCLTLYAIWQQNTP